MAKVDPLAEPAARLLQTLQQHKQDQRDYPLTAERLRELTDATISDADLIRALSHKSIAGQIVVAAKKDVTAPLALAGDEPLLAGSDLLLRFALGKVATADAPLQPIKKVLAKVDASLRPAFEVALTERIGTKSLPAGVGMREVAKKPNLYLDQFPPPPVPRSAAELLADELLARLREWHAQGKRAGLLSELVAGKVAPAVLKAALASEPFASTATLVPVSKTVQVVGLERGAVLASDHLLTALLQANTSAKKPALRPDALAELLPDADREAFRVALQARIVENRLPEGVLSRPAENDVELLLRSNLPAAQRLATEALGILHAAREHGAGHYPCRLADLLARVQVEPGSKLAKQVLADNAFTFGALVAIPGQAASPVAVVGDQSALLRAPNLLTLTLQTLRSDDTQAVPASEVSKKVVRELKADFAALIDQQIMEGTLPASVGSLRIKKKPYLFLLAEVGAKPAPAPIPAPVAAPAPIDFARMFDDAFARLDRDRGSHNLVSLVQLRQEVPLDRDLFDRELTDLRRAGRYSLVGAEGRHGLSEEERTASIIEHGNMLLFVSRRDE